ncbi:EXS-domain-containing protein, partial [Sistotremastrum suecicum HHB10207 ss-3]
IVFYIAYYHWRHRGMLDPVPFGLMVIFGTIMSTYTSAWDLTMDWSVLQTNAPYPFLRKDILYTHWIPVSYTHQVSNVCIRFIWIIYTPRQGLSTPLRTFIGGSLELLRRVQWNFFRLENEHIGNTDQYRVTREVPLPYSFDEDGESIAGDDEDARPSVKLARVETRMDVKSDEA